MSQWMPEIRACLAAAGLEPAREAEIAQELAEHLDDRYAESLRMGIPEPEARRRALAELADGAFMREQLRDLVQREGESIPAGAPSRGSWWTDLVHDLRYALRMLRGSSSFTALAVLTLAVGIGATTAIYAIVDNVLLRPLPYKDAERLVRVAETHPTGPGRKYAASYNNFTAWQSRNRTLEAIAIYNNAELILTGDTPQRVSAAAITPGFFAVNGVAPVMGRGFTSEDQLPGSERVTILTDGAWQRRFGRDAGVVGRTVATVDGPFRVIGVLPSAAFFWGDGDFFVPLRRDPASPADGRQYPVIAKLRPGVSLDEARRDMDAVARGLAAERPDVNKDWGLLLTPLHEQTVSGVGKTLYPLLGAVVCILLIACVNVAGLLVARGAARTHELAIRVALGASRWRLVRQLTTESLVLGVLGGLAGTLLAWWGVGALVPRLPVRLPTDLPVAVDVRVVAVALVASVLTAMLFGGLPALRLSRAAFSGALNDSRRTTARWGRRTGSALVLAEIALALVLLAGAGLLVRTVTTLYGVDAGIAPDRVLAMRVSPLLPADAAPERSVVFFRDLVARVAALPAVDAAAAINTAPFSGSTTYSSAAAIDSVDSVPVSPRSITPSYFTAMEIPLVAGRDFADADGSSAPKVVIVNESAATRIWPGTNPVGQHLRYERRNGFGEPLEVIGVVGNVRHQGLDHDVLNEVYQPLAQRPDTAMTLVAHTAEPRALAPALAAQIKSDLPERALAGPVRSFAEMSDRLVVERWNRAVLMAVIGALGLLLAAVGVFSLTAYAVAERTREIGVRVALGASAGNVLRTVVGSMAVPIAGGVIVGLAGARSATRVLSSFLYGVKPGDPLTLACGVLVLATVSLVACYIPARRALRVDPVVALRAE